MSSKFKQTLVASSGAVALALLVTLSAQHIEQEHATAPQIRLVSGFAQENIISQPITKPTLVGEYAPNTNILITPPTEIDFEPQKLSDSLATSPHKDTPSDNPTPTPPQNTVSITVTVPKMGDTRTVDGQKQVCF